MSGRDDGADRRHHVFVTDNVGQPVLYGLLVFDDVHIQIDAYSLTAVFFMAVNANERRQNQILHKDTADRWLCHLLVNGIKRFR